MADLQATRTDVTFAAAWRVPPFAAWYTLAVLVIVTLFAFLDRQVIILLAEQIKHSLALSDLQLGILQGTAVALFSAVAAYPLAWAADRLDRRLVLAGCIVVWSLAVIGCGLASDFTTLVVCAALVAAAEAGLAPLTFAVIPELFPVARRQLANSIFTLVSAATGSLALALGGQMIAGVATMRGSLPPVWASLDVWRLSFFVAALPAPLMIALLLTARLGGKSRGSAVAAAAVTRSDMSLIALLLGSRAALLRLFGAFGIANFAYNALLSWIVVICIRSFGQTEQQVGGAIGLAALAATPVGFALSLILTRVLGRRLGPAVSVRTLTIGYLVSGPLLGLLWLAPNATSFYLIVFAAYAINMTMGMMLPTALQALAPPALRARVISVNFIVNVLFVAGAAPLVGWLSDRHGTDPRGILASALAITVPGLLIAGLLLKTGERIFCRMLTENLRAQSAP